MLWFAAQFSSDPLTCLCMMLPFYGKQKLKILLSHLYVYGPISTTAGFSPSSTSDGFVRLKK